MSQKLQNKWDMKKHRQYKGVMLQCLMSQKLGVILPPTAAPQLLAGEKHNSQWSGQIDLFPLQGFHGQAVGKPLQRGKRLRSPSRAWKKNDTKSVSFFFSSPARARKFDVYAPLRSAQSEVPRTSCAVSRFFYLQRKPWFNKVFVRMFLRFRIMRYGTGYAIPHFLSREWPLNGQILRYGYRWFQFPVTVCRCSCQVHGR